MMKVSQPAFETAWSMLRRFIAKSGGNIAEAKNITHREGIAVVKRRIVLSGAGGTVVTVDLYHLSTARDDQGEQYDQYIGSDGVHYTEIVSTGNIYRS